ncbi:MAG: 16S rRNA (adenine(1518)-N(6)/adenine(1519)-N(6))-dimethyltransferase RsmA [Bacilli bacterium]|nr:16S rRNA (adenine(1518)-N(6)/adenine(1519)-N(6))-dimethyltransferase RsmA [Bacilli bacterium]
MIVQNTKQILQKYKQFAKKLYGQNFLIDSNVLNNIITYSKLSKQTGVIEIGPGLGALTEYLALAAKKVLAYEIDQDMVSILQETTRQYDNIVIINEDILQAELEQDIEKYCNDCAEIVVVSNLPYYITSPILFRLLEIAQIKKYILMVQKEVGYRIVSKPKTKEYGLLSVWMQYNSQCRLLSNVSANCFYPAPKVESALIEVLVTKNDYGLKNEVNFLKFLQGIFSQRRKTLSNNLFTYYGLQKEKTKQMFNQFGWKELVRAEELSVKELIDLYQFLLESDEIHD